MLKARVGLIGCGFISQAHLRGWKNNGCDVRAVCDVDKKRAESRAKEFGVNAVYDDFRRMLEHEKLDIVDIATPVATHKEIVSACSEAGRHILVEKPFVNDLEDGKNLVRQCARNGTQLMVCQTYRWHPWFEKMKLELESGTIGRPYYANIMQRIGFDIPQGENMTIPLLVDQPFYRDVGMLLLLEQGCHYLDIFRYFFGEASSVEGTVGYVSPHVKGDDLAVIILKFPGVVAVLEDLWCTNGQEKTSVCFIQGEKGSLFFEGTAGLAPHRTERTGGLECYLKDGKRLTRDLDAHDYYARCFEALERHFLECLEKDEEPMTSGRDNLRTLELAFKAYESSRQQRALFIGDLK
jgi:predicted dehydrogenase